MQACPSRMWASVIRVLRHLHLTVRNLSHMRQLLRSTQHLANCAKYVTTEHRGSLSAFQHQQR